MTEEGIYLSKEEREELEKHLTSISDYQRLSSLLVWIGILMILLHILADIYFHVVN